MCPVHLDREKTTNLSQATNKLNNRATRCVQYTWTGRKPPICHKPLSLLVACDRLVVFSRSRCTGHILLLCYYVYKWLVTDWWFSRGPGVLDTSSCSVIKFIIGLWQIGGFLPVQVYWTHRVALLLSLLVACDRLVVFSRSRCTGNILLLYY
jgi:hypothetical protein